MEIYFLNLFIIMIFVCNLFKRSLLLMIMIFRKKSYVYPLEEAIFMNGDVFYGRIIPLFFTACFKKIYIQVFQLEVKILTTYMKRNLMEAIND